MTGPRPPEPTKEILNIEEAAHLLGVSTKTFAKVLREGEIPGRKIGREWKFARRALIDWVASGRSRDFFDAGDGLLRDAALPPSRAGRVNRDDATDMSVEED